eukprot:TRINITY_DN1520_c0_g3_i1.p1 TRINITY_DN1520_c0_g3~~TRINITY_DN1520_c0_g3_i1.p1  ORF type:complete len:145 (-),score=37.55 TRINITY_DN1520_c0_g3_i1:411-845(-)
MQENEEKVEENKSDLSPKENDKEVDQINAEAAKEKTAEKEVEFKEESKASKEIKKQKESSKSHEASIEKRKAKSRSRTSHRKRKLKYTLIQHRPFVLDCCKPIGTLLPSYDSLLDPYMGNYFLRPKIMTHLVKMKIVALITNNR